MRSFRLSSRRLAGVVVIAVGGELDHAVAGRVREFIGRARRRPDDHLVFDLEEVVFMDTAGLLVLLDAERHAVRHGARTYLAAVPPLPAAIVLITRADSGFEVHAGVDEALHAALARSLAVPGGTPPVRAPAWARGGPRECRA